MERNNNVLDVTGGMTSRLQGGRETVINAGAVKQNENTVTVFNYKNPIIPEGFEYLKGEWNNGFTIINKIDRSVFVWAPVGYLVADGTLDGKNFTEKFGRRNFRGEVFGVSEYYENVDNEMVQSVNKYEGFYLAAHLASMENGKLVFKKGNMPLVSVKHHEAKSMLEHYGAGNADIVTCLPCGAMYDSVFKWIIQSGEKTFDEVVCDSKTWGNYMNNGFSKHMIMPTGSNEKWYACGFYDLAGNCDEWSTEEVHSCRVVARGSNYNNFGWWPAAHRYCINPSHRYNEISFRCAFYLK